jgi:hypothetical protein
LIFSLATGITVALGFLFGLAIAPAVSRTC